MIVVVLTACPEKLRGYLTRWLLEVSAGVFVGHVSRRVREELWSRITEMIGRGRGIMAYSAHNEQHMELVTCGHHWVPEDFEGITLIRRPPESADDPTERTGWSSAARRRSAPRSPK